MRATTGQILYPIGDSLTVAESKTIGVKSAWVHDSIGKSPDNVKAVWTKELRPPLKGEWYLSGADPTAYRAPNDLSTPFHIMRLVKIRKEESYIVEPNP